MTRKIDEVLQAAVARADVPGVVALAAGDDGVLYEGAAGMRAADAGDPITADTMLRIASMTKMVTTTAALQLHERGALDLDTPVQAYRPEFAALQVLEGFDGDAPVLRPPRAQATVRQLITHTAGLAYWFWNSAIDRYEQVMACRTSCLAATPCLPPRWCPTRVPGSSTGSTSIGWAG